MRIYSQTHGDQCDVFQRRLKLIRESDEQFTCIYESNYRTVYRFFYYKTGSKYLSEDLTAETFAKAYVSIERFDEKKASMLTWLLTIGRNVFVDNYRKYKHQIYVSYDELGEMSNTYAPESEVIGSEINGMLYKAIAQLNDKQRNLVALKYSCELKNKEIAGIIGKTERHTAVMLGRTLDKLRQILQEMGVESYE